MQNKIFHKTFNFSNIAIVRRAIILKRAIKKRSKELILKMKKIWSSPITLKGAKKSNIAITITIDTKMMVLHFWGTNNLFVDTIVSIETNAPYKTTLI